MLPIQISTESRVIAKAAGIESTANAMSAATIAARQTKIGVACRLPSIFVNQWCPWNSLETGNTLRTPRTIRFLSGSTPSSTPRRIRHASTSSSTPRM